MRLINSQDLTFKEFLNLDDVLYAIVSHRWGDEEVSYQSFLNTKPEFRTGWGWTKITKACEMALEDNYDWVWIDTCCINKDSSAELTEAINSMYDWYRRSTLCFVFLDDVKTVSEPFVAVDDVYQATESIAPIFGPYRRAAAFPRDEFLNSQWFTRGWTLQELLAPWSVRFFNGEFKFIGSKSTLHLLVSLATGIGPKHILKEAAVSPSVAERMKWCANRKTTREEDLAYCLMGIFDVNMPLLYGEGGTKAFVRLQLELLKKSEDESIFAWLADNPHDIRSWRGLLAPSPRLFASVPGEIQVYNADARYPYMMTNQGLELTLRIDGSSRRLMEPGYNILFPLNCVLRPSENKGVNASSLHRSSPRRLAILFSCFMHSQRGNQKIASGLKEYGLLYCNPCDNVRSSDFESANGCTWIGEVWGISEEGKLWTIYFRQDGL